MDTYNGSLRDSQSPCDIDKDFIDECSYCQSGKFNVDIEIEELSNDRIEEAKDIISEYVPFHCVLHSMNISGLINDFIVPPLENIETSVDTSNASDVVTQREEISYQIEWADGKKGKFSI
jgi:hypothetical protein